MKRPYKPTGIPGLFPYLTVQNAEKSIQFYENAFGFQMSSEPSRDEQNKIQHAEMKFLDDVIIMLAPEGAFGSNRKAPVTLKAPASLFLYVYCPDVDAFYQKAIKNGAKSTLEPNDGFWGDRYCGVLDRDGYEWTFATNIADHKKD